MCSNKCPDSGYLALRGREAFANTDRLNGAPTSSATEPLSLDACVGPRRLAPQMSGAPQAERLEIFGFDARFLAGSR